jgi:hypothetical protein
MPRKQKTIEAIDASLAKWKTRLRRAMTAIDKLERQRKRLVLVTAERATVGGFTGKVTYTVEDLPTPASLANDAAIAREIELAEQKREAQIADDDPFAIPPELNRADPLIAERMTAARKAAEAEARKAMPLSGRAASAYINKATKVPRKRKA